MYRPGSLSLTRSCWRRPSNVTPDVIESIRTDATSGDFIQVPSAENLADYPSVQLIKYHPHTVVFGVMVAQWRIRATASTHSSVRVGFGSAHSERRPGDPGDLALSYAALIERRTYKAPMPPQQALAVLTELGVKLDRNMLKHFEAVVADSG
jgi:hypothetical protein